MKARAGRLVFSHMIADDDLELLAMARRIGVARRWHQFSKSYKSHFDVCQAKRDQAVAAGAVTITLAQCRAMVALRRRGRPMGDPASACARLRRVREMDGRTPFGAGP